MCGRFVVVNSQMIFDTFSVVGPYMPVPRFNIAPTTGIPVVRLSEDGSRELVEMRWGLVPCWAKPESKLPLMINARSETVATSGAFRSALKTRRCIVPASGYYDWRASSFTPGKPEKQPFYFRRKDRQPIAFAAIWEEGTVKDKIVPTTATITTTPNEQAGLIHNRMPVMLSPESWVRAATMTPT